MKAWELFFPDVLPSAPGMSEPMVEHHIRRAAQEFCQRTRAWRVDLAPITTLDGVAGYALPLLTLSELVRMEHATLNAQDLAVWRGGDASCTRYIYTPDGKTVSFNTLPGAGLPLVVTASVKPGNAATGVEDFLYDRYAECIAQGAVARLTGDMMKLEMFQSDCNRIATDLWKGIAAIRPRARANFF